MAVSVQLREVVLGKTGTTNPLTTPNVEFTYVDVASVDNVSKGISSPKILVGADAPSRARKAIKSGDVLVSTIRPNLNAVALVPDSLDGQVASTGFCVLRPTDKVLSEYLYYFVRSPVFIDSLCGLVAGAMYPAVTDGQVLDQLIQLPSIAEQRRIVDLLSRAEGIVRLRREAQQKAAELVPAIFLEMFGDPSRNLKGFLVKPLSEVAEVISGVAKGRKLDAIEAIAVPYMRVANVKDGYLDLSEVKTIAIKQSELQKLRIEVGDLLMTEGGDPDKLGRAALWAGQVEVCVHQNHVFKVRSDRSKILPEYLRALAGSPYGKAYFLRVAKKTTGIASINKTQLSAFPVIAPTLREQAAFIERVSRVEAIQMQQSASIKVAESVFDSLLSQMFGARYGA